MQPQPMEMDNLDSPQIGAAHLTAGMEYVGRGVNIFTEAYLEHPNKSRMVDLTIDNVTIIPINTTEVSETFGSNFAEFLQDFSVSAGLDASYMGFTASVEAKFATSSRDSVDIKFAQLSLVSSGAIVSLSGDQVVLQRYLNPDFKKALAKSDPRRLFAAYGTHVAIKVRIGGAISYYSYSKASEHQNDSEFKFAARAKYLGFGAEVGANGELTEKEKEAAKTVEGSAHLYVNGGEEAARIKIENGDKNSYAAWAATLGTRPGFIGFQQGGLIPVWELTDDLARRAALELAFNQEAARNFQIRIFTHTGQVAAHPEARVRIPPEYKLLAGGARDNWIGAGNLLTASYPTPDNGTWIGRGKDHGHGSPASVSVFAIGIYDKPDLWEVAQFSATGAPAASPSAQVALAGDFVAKGGVLVGGGADVGGVKLLTSSYPKNTTTWAANATDPFESVPAAVKVFAQGLRCKVEGVKIEVKTNHAQSQHKTAILH